RSGRARWKGRSSSTVWDRAGTIPDCTTPGQAVRRRAAGRAAEVLAATLTLAARLAAGFSAGFFFPCLVAYTDAFSAAIRSMTRGSCAAAGAVTLRPFIF